MIVVNKSAMHVTLPATKNALATNVTIPAGQRLLIPNALKSDFGPSVALLEQIGALEIIDNLTPEQERALAVGTTAQDRAKSQTRIETATRERVGDPQKNTSQNRSFSQNGTQTVFGGGL